MQESTAQVIQLDTTPAGEDSLRDRVRKALETDPALTQAVIAREIGTGVSSTTLSQWLNGNYNGDNAKIEARVGAWFETYEERRARAGLPEAPPWVETATAKRIESCLRYGQLAQDIVVIVGPAGVSKTKACEHYATVAPAVVHVTMSPATKGVLTSLKRIVQSMGLRDVPCTAYEMQAAIIAKMRGSRGLLIIDEAQHLGIEALDEIRSLHDLAFVGIALVGNEHVYGRMTGGTRAPYLDRLYSRIGKLEILKGPSDADIDAIIAAWKIQDGGCKTKIRALARRSGGLRVLTKVLRLAASFAAAQNHALCCDDVLAAERELGASA